MRTSTHILRTVIVAFTIPVIGVAAITADDAGKPLAPTLDGLGDLHYPITTSSAAAQRFFDQGLRLVYAFNHAEAIRAFEEASRLDSESADAVLRQGAGSRPQPERLDAARARTPGAGEPRAGAGTARQRKRA